MKNKFVVIIFFIALAIVIGLLINNFLPKQVKIGEDEVILNTNAGVSYNWTYTIEDTSIVMYKNLYQKEANSKIVGGPIELHYTFEGLRPGNTKITFEYINTVDGKVAQTIVYNVTVDKDLITKIKRLTF